MIKSKSKKLIRLIDVGAGANATRARKIAQRRTLLKKPGTIVALDLNKFIKNVNPSNLRLVQKDAVRYLSKLPKGSVGMINFDLSLLTPHAEREYLKSGYIPQSDRHVVVSKEFCDAVKRALPWNGRMFINTSRYVYSDLVKELEKNGFRVNVYPLEKVYKNIQSKPLSFEELSIMLGENKFVSHSVQISVRKPIDKKSL